MKVFMIVLLFILIISLVLMAVVLIFLGRNFKLRDEEEKKAKALKEFNREVEDQRKAEEKHS